VIAQLEQRRADIEDLCRRYGVRRLEVFGSAATGAFNEDSDFDFLVEFEDRGPGYSDRYFGLLESLQALLGRPVELVFAKEFTNPYFLATVERTKALLYAA
jgi:predicted nucleotidyltransferase